MSEAMEGTIEGDAKTVQLGPKTLAIPSKWKVTRLDDVTTNSGSYGANTSAVDFDPEKPRYIRITDISDEGSLKSDDKKSIPRNEAEGYFLEDGDLLFARTGATAGKSYLYNGSVGEAAYAGYLIRFKVDESKIDSDYLRFYVQSKQYYDWVDRITRHGAQQNINASEYRNLELLLPPLPEQRRIADILATVDEQIQRTDEVLEEIEALRTGLRQTFFHKGYYKQNTEERSTLGETPEEWESVPLSEVADVEMGSSPKSKFYNNSGDGLPFFQANNEFGYRNPTHDRWCSKPSKIANTGDTLITIRGTYVGQVNVSTEKCCIGRGLAAVRAQGIDQEFLYHQLNHRERYIRSIASGSTFDSINSTELESVSVVVPPKQEQKKIAGCLKRLQEKYLEERETKQAYQDLKRGLMQDLLTGKVRVNAEN